MSIALDDLAVESFPTTGTLQVHLPSSEYIAVDPAEAAAILERAGVASVHLPSSEYVTDTNVLAAAALAVETFPTTIGKVTVHLPSSEYTVVDAAEAAEILARARAAAAEAARA